jgi:SAM-dependent methyltransferase
MKSEVTVDRWEKYQAVEAHHQGEKRIKLGFEEFERCFQVSNECFANQVCLEIGCGITGAIHYLDTAKLAIGLDPLCSTCRELYYSDNTYGTPHVTGIGEYLPIESGVIDSVFIYGVLDHCLIPANVLKEAERVLIPKGHLYIRVYTFSRIPKFIRKKLSLVDIHPHHLSKKEIIKMTEDVGLKMEWMNSIKVPFYHAWVVLKNGTLKSAIKHIGATILGIEDLSIILVKG